jgi:hypothetical protein
MTARRRPPAEEQRVEATQDVGVEGGGLGAGGDEDPAAHVVVAVVPVPAERDRLVAAGLADGWCSPRNHGGRVVAPPQPAAM